MRPRRPSGPLTLLAAPDKFRGTATAPEIAAACVAAAHDAGWVAAARPVSDGGEGFLDCFGGANRYSVVSGPLGAPARAGWRLAGGRAVIEMAAASGRALLGPAPNDPMGASTRGTGELIRAAVDAGAREILVGVGGSASTDGGSGALTALGPVRFGGAGRPRLIVACDVQTTFLDAARVFAPQKGATAAQVDELTVRLRRQAEDYRQRFGRDVTVVPGSGAAGGLAGGLAALGADLVPGFEVVAERTGLDPAIATADLVVTGEGRFDDTSALGKAALGVVARAARVGTRAVIIAGELGAGPRAPVPVISLAQRFGEQGRSDPAGCVRRVVEDLLADWRVLPGGQ